MFVALAGSASAGGDAKVTVNSTANIDDGACEGPPNNDALGNCTLHEAIDMVNEGDADVIRFHPPVFSKEQPGEILLCTSEGALPDIVVDLRIESKDSGVIIDGGRDNDSCSSGPVSRGLLVEAKSNGLDFTLNGGKNFTIRNLECPNLTGIHVDGDGYSLGTIDISGIMTHDICGPGVFIEGTDLESGSVTNSDLSSDDAHGVLVRIDACLDDCALNDSVLDISGNRIQGGKELDGAAGEGQGEAATGLPGDGVNVAYVGYLDGGKITVGVTENELINGNDNAVDLQFEGCGFESGVNFHVDRNGELNGSVGDAVQAIMFANICFEEPPGAAVGLPAPSTSDEFIATVSVNGNRDIENHGGSGQEGVHVNLYICCEESDSSAVVEVNDNGRITGEDDGVEIGGRCLLRRR